MCFEAHARVIRRFVDHEICFVSYKYRCSQLVSLNFGVTTAAGRDVAQGADHGGWQARAGGRVAAVAGWIG